MRPIETERLVLRSFTPEDWRDVRELALDWKAAPGPAFDKWPTSAEACRELVRHLSRQESYFAMCLRGSGKVVGLLAVNRIDANRQADLGHVILSKYQDNDLDREALRALVRYCFEVLGARSIITFNAAEFAPQIAPLKSLGFGSTNPAKPGELTLGKAQWERRP